jgi:cytoskeleton protein RodZ
MSAERADQPVPDHHGIPGKTLAAQREAMGWTVEQVADQLKLAVRQVVALEQGDYANLPGPAVVRGFVRAYAKVVKLDAAPLVAQIALDSQSAGDTTSSVSRRDKPASFSQVRYPSNGKRASKLPLALIAGAVLLIGGAAAAWQFGAIPTSLFNRDASVAGVAAPGATSTGTSSGSELTVLPPPIQDRPVVAEQAARPADAPAPVITNSVPLISVPPPSPSGAPAPGAGSPVGVAPAGVSPSAAAPAAAAAAAAADALVLAVREDSWIEVRPAKGRSLFSGMVKAGTIETVKVTEPVTLIVGKPGAVDATLRGAPLVLPAVPGGRVARVQLK